MKYTIELTDKQKAQMDCIIDIVHRYVGFNPKLEPIKTTNVEDTKEYQIGYKVGFEDSKKIADKDLKELQHNTHVVAYNKALEDVNCAIEVLRDMTETEREEWFEDYASVDEVVREFTIQRIIESTRAYEEKKKADEESIKRGDEVKDLGSGNIGVVMSIGKFIVYITNNGVHTNTLGSLEKTGRHFDEVEQLLSKLQAN